MLLWFIFKAFLVIQSDMEHRRHQCKSKQWWKKRTRWWLKVKHSTVKGACMLTTPAATLLRLQHVHVPFHYMWTLHDNPFQTQRADVSVYAYRHWSTVETVRSGGHFDVEMKHQTSQLRYNVASYTTRLNKEVLGWLYDTDKPRRDTHSCICC